MITRVTSHSMMQNSLRNLQGSLAAMAKLQDQATSQKAITRPSDDPSATTTTMSLHAAQARNDQYARNINDGLGWVTTADTALTQTTALLGRARDLTVQAANTGAMSPTALEGLAVELESLREELLAQANSSYLGRPVFAGTSPGGAFDRDTYAFKGVTGDGVTRRVSESQSIKVDADGAKAFGEGANSVFATIDSIVADIRSGANPGTRIGDLDKHRETVIGVQGSVGANQSMIERAQSTVLSTQVALETQRTNIEDVDAVEVFMQLQTKQLVYQAALSVTAKALPTNLMEYMR